MKKIFWILMGMVFLGTSCTPKIYGVHKHRRDRHCGCEYVAPENNSGDCLANYEEQ